MTKLWCIALSFGAPPTGSMVLTHYLCPTSELATAECVSRFYTENPGVRTPLTGVAVLELSRDRLEAALRAMDEDEQKPPGVVQLVPREDDEAFLKQDGADELALARDLHLRWKHKQDEPA